MGVYTLYNRPGSGGFAVEAALVLAGQPYEFMDVGNQPGEKMPETFRAINPWGQVPALILPDGGLMTETGAILTYLAGAHGEADSVAAIVDVDQVLERMHASAVAF